MIPSEPMMLLSYVNMKLRDFYSGLEEFCEAEGIEREEIERKLKDIDYVYDEKLNRFV